jgi:membrane protein
MVALDRLKRWRDARLEVLAQALERTRAGRFALDVGLAAWTVARGFRGEKISLRASALTYISIFALVPLLTVALGLVELLGRHDLHAQVREFLFDLLAPGIAEESAAMLDRFLGSATSAAAGGVGLVVLMFSAGTLIKNLDTSINEIWNVRKKRSIPVRAAIYLGVMVLGPALLALSLAGMGVVRAWATPMVPFSAEILTAAGALVSVGGFTFMYLVGPHVKVRFRSALAGGLVAGLSWDLAKHLYGEIASQIFRASPVWGSLTALPLLLTWIYLSWLLLLFGARLSYAVQYAWFRGSAPDLGAFPRAEALVGARLSLLLTEAAATGAGPLAVRKLPRRLGVTEERLDPVLERLVASGIVRLLPGGYVEAGRPIDELTLEDTALAIGAGEGGAPGGTAQPKPEGVEGAFQRAEEAFLQALRQVRWRDLPMLDRRATDEAPRSAASEERTGPAGSVEQKP